MLTATERILSANRRGDCHTRETAPWRTHPPIQGVSWADPGYAGPRSGPWAGDLGAAGERRTDAQIQDLEPNCPGPGHTCPGATHQAEVASPIIADSALVRIGAQLTLAVVACLSTCGRVRVSDEAAGERGYYPPVPNLLNPVDFPKAKAYLRWGLAEQLLSYPSSGIEAASMVVEESTIR